ncbi:ABC transporter ATP-binding protein [Pseudonocardia humida]|uniref:ABC transporter ATP-binding protein n=1 Tax=Pseudonocardia humida TaxID=2800819 RepID=A0ABT1A808_9PSEU|nr:ABC transporter ATP-binding protein [Pseudonocardia humida]MCO1659154.1 ABC transporter ATP-binding protein [Pseudonocardia humida]
MIAANPVSLTGVSKRYREVAALDEVSIELAPDTIHGLLGRNGAGKTTLMHILTGQAFETGGDVRVFGEHPYENAAVLRRVCFVKESQRYPDWFAVRHAFKAAALLYPNWDARFAADLVADFDLPLGRRIKKLSRGQLSAVGVVIGLAAQAPLTIFDEPYLGLDAVARQLFYDRLLADYAERPRTVVLSTHLIDEVSDLIEHVVLLDRGRVLLDGDAESLRGDAVTVSGPSGAVSTFVAGYDVLHREEVGGMARVTVRGVSERPDFAGLSFEPVSLQQLVVRTAQSRRAATAARTRDDGPVGAGNGNGGRR